MYGSGLDDRYSVSGRDRVFYPIHYVQNVITLAQSHFPSLLVLTSFSSGVMQWLYEVDHSCPSSDKFNNEWCYISTAITSSPLTWHVRRFTLFPGHETALAVRPGFSPRPDHVGFMIDKVALKWVFLNVLWFFHLIYSTRASYSFIHSFIKSFIDPFIHSFIHS